MTRVVVPRGNASNTTQSRAPAASSASSVPPPPPLPSSNALPTATEDSDHVSEAPVPSRDGDLTENASQLVSSLRLDESRYAGSDCEGAREQESTAVQTPSVSASSSDDGSLRTGTVAATSSTSSSAVRAPTGLRRGNSVASSRGYSAQRIRISATSSSNAQATEGDGYNSADETNPWASGPPAFEEDEDKEGHFEEELRRVKGLEVRRMLPDGNCLFRAVADQVYGDPEMYADTRQMCIDYMERERDHFSQFVTEGFTAYCKRKRRDKVYGNNLEIQAMAEMYNRPIHIYSYSTDPINIFHGQYQTDLPPIRLSYHRKNHYNALHDPSRPAVGAGLGFGSLRGNNVDRDQVKAAIRAQQDQQIENALLAEGRYYSDLELTEQEIERMVMEASRAEYLAEERYRQIFETSSSAGGEPSTSGAARGSGSGGSQVSLTATTENNNNVVQARNSNVRMLLSMGFNYFRVMEACSIFGDDVNNMLCYLLETDSLGESMYRMKGKAAEK